MTVLNFTNTPVSDLTPLVKNEGLGEGDVLGVQETNLELCPGAEDRDAVDTLIERGVTVAFDEPENCDGDSGDNDQIVNIPDPVLERNLRLALDKPEGPITKANLESLTSFLYDEVDSDDPRFNIASIEGLQYAVNLESLDLRNNGVKDFSPLAPLTKLTELVISGSTDIDALSGLVNLEDLELGMVGDLSPLSNLTKLKYLHVSTSNPSAENLSALQNLTNLEGLNLQGEGFSDLSVLSNLTKLKTLNLFGTLSDLSFTQSLTALEDLDLYLNGVTNFDSLGDLPSLKTLESSENPLQDVSGLAKLPQGLSLDLDVPLDNLEGLSKLTNLSAIQNYAGTTDISQLAALKQLKEVRLSYNQITDLTPLAALKQLSSLALIGNTITDITPLSGLTNLCYVFLDQNAIEDIEPLVISSNNGGFSRGNCFIYLYDNPLNTDPGSKARENIDTLRSRGIQVNYNLYPAE